jgi:hypothetical protein
VTRVTKAAAELSPVCLPEPLPLSPIIRRGKPIAAMVPRRPVRDLLPQLQALREALPPQPSSGVDAVRAQRDDTER